MTQAEVADSGVLQPTFHGVLRHREFRGLWLAQITSSIGDQLAKIALAILVYHRTNSVFLASLAYAVTYLPALVAGPVSGLLADIRPRREVMVVCDLVRAVLVALMCLPGIPIFGLLAILLAVSAVESPFAAARAALVPDLLEGEAYPVGQSLTQVTDQVAQILGFGVGGAVVALLSAQGALAVDAATFLGSAYLLRVLVRSRPAPATRSQASVWIDALEGARVVWSSPLLRNLILVTVVSLGCMIATEGLAVSYAAQLGRGNVAAGLLTAAVPSGMAIGYFLVPRVFPPVQRLAAVRTLAVLWPLPLIATALHPPVAIAIALWSLTGLLGSYHLLANLLFAQALAPALRGRAFAFARALIIAIQGVGLLLAGLVGQWTSPATAIAVAGLTGALICPLLVALLRNPGRHRVHQTELAALSHGSGRRYNGMAVASLEEVSPAHSGQPHVPPLQMLRKRATASWWRGHVVILISLAVVLVVATEVFSGWLPPVPDRHALRLPWWALTAGFAVAYFFGIPFQRGKEALFIILEQIPIVLGLLLGSPEGLFVAAMIGACAVHIHQPLVPIKFFVNRAAGAVEVGVACGIFALLRPDHENGWQALAAAFIACLAADLCSVLSINLLRRVFDPTYLLRDMLRPLAFLLISGMAASSLGLLSVAAIWTRPSYGWLLVLVAALVLGGSRAFADLQERHQGLNELYELQGHLGPLLPSVAELHPVLIRTRDILTANQVELVIDEVGDPQLVSGGRRTITLDSSGLLRESWRNSLANDNARDDQRLTVVLSAGDRRLGTLSVCDRLGTVRGYNRRDLHLLETIGTHVSNALERGRLLERLRLAATHDSLTGLLNLNELSRIVDERVIRGESCALILCDVARLKDVNDSLGHDAGDALLCTVAERLGDYTSPNAVLARAGGGEFAIALMDVSDTDAGTAVGRIATGLSGLVQVLGVTIDLRTRLGWALSPDDGRDSADLLRRADLALGSAKRELQRSARYGLELEIDGLRRLRLVNDLRLAIDACEIDVAFQPLVTPRDGQVIGAEALARWQHPEFGPLPPDEFIVVAEQSGLIGPLTELVLDKALAQTRVWHLEGRNLRVAVNLSPRCLTDLGLPGLVLDLLARHRVEPSKLTLEITESSVAEDPGRAEAVLARLRGLGVRLSIDDFGTGYSTLASLKRFPVQEVKLDRQFLIDLDKVAVADAPRGVDIALLTAIVALGHSLELEIVAEGVETADVYAQLRDLGVDVLQGYFMGRPLVGGSLPTHCHIEAGNPHPPGEAGPCVAKEFLPIT